ncbi:penicillin-binding protein 1C [Luteolibacter pohnpeiensis]|uniref:peptidoglycan glycosyltransferase n=2 Tax=Luteolibacter pohnpeiensis TaxID=454153 RepID=A0A934VQ75_9BACT|nr:penicillin-binding protein 1C [Luteolibacter pohnpeiensis]
MLIWFAVPFAFPIPPRLLKNPAGSPILTDRHGLPLHHLTFGDSTRMIPLEFKDIPPDLLACTLAAEDKRFFEHGGVDLLSISRATRDFVLHRRVTSGASTITQQLIKISSPRRKRNLGTKLREAFTARHLEMIWSKDQILTAYLNRLDYGNLRIGSAEAARFYFQKPLADLSLAESALLAGLPQAPSRLNPLRHPQRAVKRRNMVLERLADNPAYSATRISTAMHEPLELRPLRQARAAPWLPDFSTGSTKHRTSLDLPLQKAVERIVREETAKLRDSNLRHAAVVVIDNPTGEVLALVSSASWDDPRGGQLNGALIPRSPGSTLKPFTYLLAFQQEKLTPASILADIPSPFRTPQGLDLPENYDRCYRGPVTLRTALACSLNVPALRELNELGGPTPLYHLLQKLGIDTFEQKPEFYGLGLTLGNAPVRLLDLTNAYAAIARGGISFPPTIFLPAEITEKKRWFDAISAYLMADILSDSTARAPAFTPGGPLDLPFRCAVKTGTSSDFHDNWCVGFTPDFTVGVWAGNFEQQPMKGLSGIDGAGPIFHRTMLELYQGTSPHWFAMPEGLSKITIDRRNGKLLTGNTANQAPQAVSDLVPTDRIPMLASASDYNVDGQKALLDPIYSSWFNSSYNQRRGELAMNAKAVSLASLKIISPRDGATFLIDPEIPSGSDQLRPITNLPGVAQWSSATLKIEQGSPEPMIHLVPGDHILTATDPRDGSQQHLTLHVKSM